MFQILFCLAVSDCYLNGPSTREEEKYIAIAFSIIALLFNTQWFYIVAELVWFLIFARATWELKSISPESSQTGGTQESKPPSTENLVPDILKRAILDSKEKFLKNRIGDRSCDGETWEEQSRNDGDVISRAKYPGQAFYRWRVQGSLFGTFEGIISEMFDYSKRCGGVGGWDANLAKGEIVKDWDGGYRLCMFSTNPVYGGAVSGREFVEARIIEKSENEFLVSGVGLEEKEWRPKLGSVYPTGDKNLTKALIFPGGGFHMSQANPDLPVGQAQDWKYELVTNSALGGWIPTVTINKATASVLAEATVTQKKHMKDKFKA